MTQVFDTVYIPLFATVCIKHNLWNSAEMITISYNGVLSHDLIS